MKPYMKEGVNYTIISNSYAGVNWLDKHEKKPPLEEFEAAFMHLYINPTDDIISKAEIKAMIKKRRGLAWGKFKDKIFRRK